MIICPNLNNPEVAREFEELVQATSEQAAYHIWSLNNGNAIDKAPNGAESKLFLTLLEYYNGDRTKAIQAKAKTYGKSFLLWFGDWTHNSNTEPKVKFYAPTMGKTTAAKSNPNLIDFDDLVREDIKKLADKLGKTVREVKTESGKEYKQLLLDAINEWKNNPENIGKTLVVSNAVLAKEKIFDNDISIPSRDVFVRRLVERSEEDKSNEELTREAELYYDDLLSKWYDNPTIDNRYVSDIENSNISKVVDENGEPLPVWHGGYLTDNNSMPNPTYTEEIYNEWGEPFPGRELNPGIWFTTDKEYTDNFSRLKYVCFLNIKHPYYGDNLDSSIAAKIKELEDYSLLPEDIMAAGGKTDGLIGHDSKKWGGATIEEMKNDPRVTIIPKVSKGIEFAIYYPNQAKSIDSEGPTPHEGTFSRENDDIYYQILTDSEYSEMIEELELSRDSTDSFIYNFVTKVLNVKPNYKVNENSSDSAWYAYFNANTDPSYTNRERTEKLIRKIFGYDANIVFNDRQSLIESINEELDRWVENLEKMIENPLDLSGSYKKRNLILLRIKDLKRYNKGKLSFTDAELTQILDYVDELNSKAGEYSKLTESQRVGYEIVKLKKELLSVEQQIQSLIFKRHSIIVSAKNRLVAINTIDNIRDLIKNRILLEYEAYQPKDDFIKQKVLPFENLIKKIKKATLSNNYENRTEDLINLDQQTDITYNELYEIITRNHHEFANLIGLFRNANPDLKIKIGGDPEEQVFGVIPGKFNPKSNTLTLYNGCDIYTIIHELAHSATFFGIFGRSEKSEEFSKKIEIFMNYIRKYISDNKLNPGLFVPYSIMEVSAPAEIYGFTNESEFIAELYGNPSFLDLLDSIPAMDKKQFKSLLHQVWDSIVDFLNSILGKNRLNKTALDQAKELGLTCIYLQQKHINDIYDQLKEISNRENQQDIELKTVLYIRDNTETQLFLFGADQSVLDQLKSLGTELMNKCKG